VSDINPTDRQQELARIAARRKMMLDAEETMRKKKTEEKKEFESRGRSSFQDEVKAAAARGVEREEWRQEQHAKKREEHEEKLRLEELRKEELLKEEKKKEFAAEQRKDMETLHDMAVKKKLAARGEAIEKEERDTEKRAAESADREGHGIDVDLDRSLVSIAREMRKKEDQMNADLGRRRKMLEDSYLHAKHLLAQEEKRALSAGGMSREAMNIGHERMQLESEHKRQLMKLDKEQETGLLKMKQERESLEREAKTLARQKHAKVEKEHGSRVREAHQRHDTALEWIGLNDPEAEGK